MWHQLEDFLTLGLHFIMPSCQTDFALLQFSEVLQQVDFPIGPEDDWTYRQYLCSVAAALLVLQAHRSQTCRRRLTMQEELAVLSLLLQVRCWTYQMHLARVAEKLEAQAQVLQLASAELECFASVKLALDYIWSLIFASSYFDPHLWCFYPLRADHRSHWAMTCCSWAFSK